jgi:soluble lytic murein transglycosylase-like protein
MRACVIAAAVLALTQPALAAKSHKKSSHRHHVSHFAHHHHSAHRLHAARRHAVKHRRAHARVRRSSIEAVQAAPQAFARTNATDRTFGDPSLSNRSWQQGWGSDRPWQDGWSSNSSQQDWAAPAGPWAAPFGAPAPRMRGTRVRDRALDAMIARHAAANGLPVALVHRVVTRESGYNPRARNGSNLGLMQIKHATARGVGYTGPASGLMDPETNLTYAVRYLAGAYRAAGGNANRAVALYARGYHGRGVRRTARVAVTPWQTEAAWQQW